MTTISRPAASALIEETTARVRREYGGAIGHHRSELVTPALVLDLPAAKRNIDKMAARIKGLPAEIRPHIKVHKSPGLSRLQVDAGAIGLSTATVWEAMVLAAAGLDHLFVVNTVAGPHKMAALAELARERRRHGRRRRRGQRRRPGGSGPRGGQRAEGLHRGRHRHGPRRHRHRGGRRRPRSRDHRPEGPPDGRRDRLRGSLLAHARARVAPRARAEGHGHVRRPSPSTWNGRASPAPSGRPAALRHGSGPPRTRASPRSRPARTPSWTISMAPWWKASSIR